ncbi:MAG: outer membrane lipoprotein carrier protein LolA [Deltaproteobacteria bacterium]|nr:outer membrane lipoprotein carrier protein LolA [Deltaproteobacteria bacterium]
MVFLFHGMCFPGTPILNPITVKDILNKIEQKYSKIDDIEMNFEQTIIQELFDKKTTSTGKIFSIRPGKFLWHTKNPDSKEELLVISNREQWLYQPSEKIVYYSLLSEDDFISKITILFLKSSGKLEDYFVVQFLGKEDDKVLALYPKKKIPNVHRIELIYDFKTFLLMGLRIRYDLNKTTVVSFSDVKLNQKLFEKHKETSLHPLVGKEDFRFQTPSDVTLENLTSTNSNQ